MSSNDNSKQEIGISNSKLLSCVNKRIIMTIEIRNDEDLHVGSEKEISISKVDLPILKSKNGQPLIPASSIKGVLRAYFSRIINNLSDTDAQRYNLKKTPSNLSELEKEFTKEENFQNKISFIEKLGTIDKLFGISGLAANIIITDARYFTKENDQLPIRNRKHVKMDLNTDTNENLFDLEAVIDNSAFECKIIYDEIGDQLYNDVNYFIKEIFIPLLERNEGLELWIGGMKSRGYGHCTMKLKDKKEVGLLDLLNLS
ncbi:MAG: RAMP superfamily CRISPR-associated protein [Promethearchaeota archaeon]